MYNKGDLKLLTPPCEEQRAEGWCDQQAWDAEHGRHSVGDARNKNQAVESMGVYLEHSCGEWVIGGPDNVRAMIEDLTEALKKMEAAK